MIYGLSGSEYEYYIHKNILKIPKLEQKIINLEETNEYLMKNLKEQIEINSKLCERIFEMKEEKFKDEKS